MAYVKNTWETGDTVTATKLNNIENGIETIDTTKAVANPSGSATATLNKLGIDGVVYSIEGGGGSTLYQHNITLNAPTAHAWINISIINTSSTAISAASTITSWLYNNGFTGSNHFYEAIGYSTAFGLGVGLVRRVFSAAGEKITLSGIINLDSSSWSTQEADIEDSSWTYVVDTVVQLN